MEVHNMENVMTNGFAELSDESLINTDGGFVLTAGALLAIGIGAEALAAAGVGIWCYSQDVKSARISAEAEIKLRSMGYKF